MTSWIHILAILAGAARTDGDMYAHFGSLLGFDDHLAIAKRLDLVQPAPTPGDESTPEPMLTDLGRAFVEQFRLTELPAGRANNWQLNHTALTDPAAAELARRCDALNATHRSM